MTSLVPRGPYSQEELYKLYPASLELQLVQVLLRHGERSPVSARFQNAVQSATFEANENKWTPMEWRRRLETFGADDGPLIAAGPKGEVDAVCNLGELTDTGRLTTWKLGQRLRQLYVDQLHFMPPMIQDADMIYLRATPIPRALDSLQQTFWGMYPINTRAAAFPPPTIITRAPSDETLFPNDGNCRRFAALSRAFAQRTADRWNNTPDMEYLNTLISKWMPEGRKRVAVDSHPRLSGIMDTINSTLAHGPETRLPKEFYDVKGRKIIEKIGVEEWFSGYQESTEYRALGIGGLMGDVLERMVGSVQMDHNDRSDEISGKDGFLRRKRGGESAIKLGLSGCHDTTLAAVLASLGTFEGEPWPPYTSHIALEMFKKNESGVTKPDGRVAKEPEEKKSWFSVFFGGSGNPTSASGTRRKIEQLSEGEKAKLDGYYVRIRYNDKVMSVPGCKPTGKHLDGDDSFCTLEAFKAIVDKFTPVNWKQGCASNLDAPVFPSKPEPSGY